MNPDASPEQRAEFEEQQQQAESEETPQNRLLARLES
jgi:hypothetical protein